MARKRQKGCVDARKPHPALPLDVLLKDHRAGREEQWIRRWEEVRLDAQECQQQVEDNKCPAQDPIGLTSLLKVEDNTTNS
jgi:hypothetical protein